MGGGAHWCNFIEFITIDNLKLKEKKICSSLVLLLSDLMRWKGTVGRIGHLAGLFSLCWKLSLEAHCDLLALLVPWQPERLVGGAGRAATGYSGPLRFPTLPDSAMPRVPNRRL